MVDWLACGCCEYAQVGDMCLSVVWSGTGLQAMGRWVQVGVEGPIRSDSHCENHVRGGENEWLKIKRICGLKPQGKMYLWIVNLQYFAVCVRNEVKYIISSYWQEGKHWRIRSYCRPVGPRLCHQTRLRCSCNFVLFGCCWVITWTIVNLCWTNVK